MMRWLRLALTALGLALLVVAPAKAAHPGDAHASAIASTQGANARYAMNGCYAMRSEALNRSLTAGQLRLQATELGRYRAPT